MNKLILLSLATFAALFLGQSSAFAQDIAPQPCDPQVYRQMQSRAWLESEREIMQNQNLIFKADSVLNYTCFDNFARKAAADGGSIFAHNSAYFPGIIARGDGASLNNALNNVVIQALAGYFGPLDEGTFGHSYLGGRGEYVGLGFPINEPPEIGGDDSFAYECNVMAQVWSKAKCLNFVHDVPFQDKDGYYPFKSLECAEGQNCERVEGYDELIDTRSFPEYMACESEGPLHTWDAEYKLATNTNEPLYQFQSPLGEVFLDVLDKTLPGECGKPGINTGVTVVLDEGPAHQDGVCTNPGCTYNAGGTCSAAEAGGVDNGGGGEDEP